MSVTTAQDIINGALRLLQVKSPDVTLTAAESNDALDALNLMIDSWSNDSLMVHHIIKEDFTLVAGQSVYTIGTGGDFNTSRPVSIETATIRINNSDYGVIPVAYDDWAAIRLKSLGTNFVEYLYLDESYPLANIWVYPIPTSTINITLYSRKPLTTFANLTDTFSLPPGYARALKHALAVELAPEYQTSAGDDVKRLAVAAMAAIKRTNRRVVTMQPDLGIMPRSGRRYNIYSNR